MNVTDRLPDHECTDCRDCLCGTVLALRAAWHDAEKRLTKLDAQEKRVAELEAALREVAVQTWGASQTLKLLHYMAVASE